MPRGDKTAYTDKQRRKAEHIEQSYESRGVPKKAAEARAYATVNKQDGGGMKSGTPAKVPAKRKTSEERARARHESGENAAETRKAGRRLAPSSVEEEGGTAGGKAAGKKAGTRAAGKKAAAKKAATKKAAKKSAGKTPAAKKAVATKVGARKAAAKKLAAKKAVAKRAAAKKTSR